MNEELQKRLLEFQAAAIRYHDVRQNYSGSEAGLKELEDSQQEERRTYHRVVELFKERGQ